METDPTFEFEFYLATQLSRTVAELRQMDNDEFVSWSVYYARRAQRDELAMKQGGRR